MNSDIAMSRGRFSILILLLVGLAVAGCGSTSSSLNGIDVGAGGNGTGGNGIGAPIRFDFSNSVGLALVNNSTRSAAQDKASATVAESDTSGSNLKKVSATGVLSDCVTSGTASVSKVMIASEKIYVLFNSKVNLETSTASDTGCLLAQVNTSNGAMTCIDTTLWMVSWRDGPNDPIQFDEQGAIYYMGLGTNGTVLRKYFNGSSHDLINGNITISDFVVNSDGSIILTGATNSPGASWTRFLSAAGGLSNLSTMPSNFIAKFPDNNVYMTLDSGGNNISRFLVSSGVFDSKYFMAGGGGPFDPATEYYNVYEVIRQPGSFSKLVKTSSGKVYVAAMAFSPPASQSALFQYYPTPAQATTSVIRVSALMPVLTYLLVTGTDAVGNNILTLYDTSNDTEQNLLFAYNIEIYHLNFNATENKIRFDGLNFANNQMVLGDIDLVSKSVNLVSIGNGSAAKLDDFKTF